MKIRSGPLRFLLALIFAIMLVPMLGEFFVEIAKENGFYEKPTERVRVLINLIYNITGQDRFLNLLFAAGGIALGTWLIKADGHKDESEKGRSEFFERPFATEKVVVRDEKFKFQIVEVDGKSFQNCSFEHVTLLYKGTGNYDFIDCKFTMPLMFDFSDDRLKGTLGFVQLAQQSGIPIKFVGD